MKTYRGDELISPAVGRGSARETAVGGQRDDLDGSKGLVVRRVSRGENGVARLDVGLLRRLHGRDDMHLGGLESTGRSTVARRDPDVVAADPGDDPPELAVGGQHDDLLPADGDEQPQA